MPFEWRFRVGDRVILTPPNLDNPYCTVCVNAIEEDWRIQSVVVWFSIAKRKVTLKIGDFWEIDLRGWKAVVRLDSLKAGQAKLVFETDMDIRVLDRQRSIPR